MTNHHKSGRGTITAPATVVATVMGVAGPGVADTSVKPYVVRSVRGPKCGPCSASTTRCPYSAAPRVSSTGS